jgi:hypothetical protein
MTCLLWVLEMANWDRGDRTVELEQSTKWCNEWQIPTDTCICHNSDWFNIAGDIYQLLDFCLFAVTNLSQIALSILTTTGPTVCPWFSSVLSESLQCNAKTWFRPSKYQSALTMHSQWYLFYGQPEPGSDEVGSSVRLLTAGCTNIAVSLTDRDSRVPAIGPSWTLSEALSFLHLLYLWTTHVCRRDARASHLHEETLSGYPHWSPWEVSAASAQQ